MPPFTSLLVANRGEIAVRVLRAASRAGLRTVAVFSDADALAAHVGEADRAVRLGPTPATESYLHAERLLAAAAESGAQAVHPGYGFLSEQASFARQVIDAGLVWVGPPAEVMEQMGRKDRAREIAAAAGIPVIPTHELSPSGMDRTTSGGDEPGYPVLVKAAAGGGGKGMRVVREPAELAVALEAAGREAAHAFGDDTLLLERFVEGGRHVEVQVLADTHGHVLHLFERDCSVQRRHQKVLEEAPAPTIPGDLRRRLCEAAVALSRKVGYVNAGTVEFLVAGDEFFFLEMNTRLQVEHPVTEAVTGLDLVALQLRVAAGNELPFTQDQVRVTGHAIEARVYAEDPYAGFLPQAGIVGRADWPTGLARVDTALRPGEEVSTAYDPMLGKITVHAASRSAAIGGLVAALDRTTITGISTNVGFVRRLAAGPAYADAQVHTGWLDNDPAAEPYLRHPDVPEVAWPRAAHAVLAGGPARDRSSPFGTGDGWRLAGDRASTRVLLRAGGHTRFVPAVGADLRYDTQVGVDAVDVVIQGTVYRFERPDAFGAASQHLATTDTDVVAPMPGTVLVVHVDEGDRVDAGAALGVLEAMKMELTVTAPASGTVAHVGARPGDQVPIGQVLFSLDPDQPQDGG